MFNHKALEIMNQEGFYPDSFFADGRIHAFKTNPSDREKKGWYIAFEKTHGMYLVFNDWRRGRVAYKVYVRDGGDFDFKTVAEHQRVLDDLQEKANRQQSFRQETARIEAQKIWSEAGDSKADSQKLHAYVSRKNLDSHYGGGVYKGRFVLPVMDVEGKIWGLQYVSDDGKKMFHTGTKKKGNFFSIGNYLDDEPIFFAEGFATAASIHELTGRQSVVCFDAGNISPVVQNFRNIYPRAHLVVAADADIIGLSKAHKASANVSGLISVIQPQIPYTHVGVLTDFNDLVCHHGKDYMRSEMSLVLKLLEEKRRGKLK